MTQSNQLQHLARPLPGVRQPEQPGVKHQVFLAGQVVVEQGAVTNDADPAPHLVCLLPAIKPGDANLSGVGSDLGGQDPEQGRLAGAVSPQQNDELAPIQRQIQAPEYRPVAEAFFNPLGVDGKTGRLIRQGLLPAVAAISGSQRRFRQQHGTPAGSTALYAHAAVHRPGLAGDVGSGRRRQKHRQVTRLFQ